VCFLGKSLNFSNESFLFTGDTVFVGLVGRTDLPTGDEEALFQTIQRLKSLAPELWILPGHHYSNPRVSTLSQELLTNDAFRARTLEEFRQIP
jgi:glyoxylase-like metal-dependent hydrolase (beta-lactamase superfamily II)